MPRNQSEEQPEACDPFVDHDRVDQLQSWPVSKPTKLALSKNVFGRSPKLALSPKLARSPKLALYLSLPHGREYSIAVVPQGLPFANYLL